MKIPKLAKIAMVLFAGVVALFILLFVGMCAAHESTWKDINHAMEGGTNYHNR